LLVRIVAYGTALHLASWLAVAQPPPKTLTLEDCLRLASAARSSATIARRQVEIARYGLTQARAGFLPQARLGNSFTYNSPLLYDRGMFSFIPLNGIREYATLFTAGVELDSSGKLRAELARAQAERRGAEAGARLSERDLKRAVTASYLRVLLARHLVEVTRESLAEAQSFEKRVRLLFENGEAAQADVVKAAAASAFVEQSLNAAELDAQLASQELASFWTAEVNEPLLLADVLAQPLPPPGDRPPGKPFLKRPEFDLLEAQRQAALADSRRARAERLPQLGLAFQYGLDSTRVRWADRGYATFLTLNVPVFDWLKAHSATRQAQLRAQQAEDSRAAAERALAREYESALARIRLIYQQIAMAESQVKSSEENLRLSRLRYEGGEGSALDVVTAQTQLTQARASYYATRSHYLNAKADLEVASGQ
jgi:outer membrane protein TolC